MNTFLGKSKIQIVLEINERLHKLKDAVREFVMYYDTDNMIYGLENGKPTQLQKGFLSVEKTCENLEEALDTINSENGAIQILNRENNGRVYRVGTIKPLSECNINDNVVVDIKTLQEL